MTDDIKIIEDKVSRGERLSREDGLFLLSSPELETISRLADRKRRSYVGDDVYYATTLYIHPTNLCELSCPMCSFYAKPGWKTAWKKAGLPIDGNYCGEAGYLA